jgi:hypothetical protein
MSHSMSETLTVIIISSLIGNTFQTDGNVYQGALDGETSWHHIREDIIKAYKKNNEKYS